MSIKIQNDVKALQVRIEALERIVNQLNPEPRKVAGTPDPDPKPVKRTKVSK
jgi:hypothetical protein